MKIEESAATSPLVKRVDDGGIDDINAGPLADVARQLARSGEADAANICFLKALALDPSNAVKLGDYATFLANQLGEVSRADAYYRRALEADPLDAVNLGRYALFLDGSHPNNHVKGDYAAFLEGRPTSAREAGELFLRAVTADPHNVTNLSNYALFLDGHGEYEGAENYYLSALGVDPNHFNSNADYTKLLFALGRDEEASMRLGKALAIEGMPADNELELWIYAYAHLPDQREAALSRVKALLSAGARSAIDLQPNIERARVEDHPNIEMLELIGEVLAERSEIGVLEAFEAWRAA